MEILKYTKQNFTDKIQETLRNQGTIAEYCIYDKHHVLAGVDDVPDKQVMDEYGMDFIDIPSLGGSIVVCPGDIHFGIITPQIDTTNSFLDKARENMYALIKSHGLDYVFDNNDILIDGYKVMSSFSRVVNGVCIGGFQVSINVDLDLIKKICHKEMKKIPKGLSEFGITTEEVEQQVVLKTAAEYNL